MAKQSQVKSRKKCLNPLFHLQTEKEDDIHITRDVIRTVRKTGQLNLSGRHLSHVPPKLFTIYDTGEDKAVTIDFNASPREDEAWWNIKALTHLDLSSNVLSDLSADLGMFVDLVTLDLHDNSLTSLPPTLGDLQKLTKLNLNHNKITDLPPELCTLTELRELTVSHNSLQAIPAEISDLVMLRKLDLSNICIDVLPPGLGFLIRLTEINLSHNKLAELPPDIVNLRDLLKLDVRNNNLTILPDMCELRKLQILYATHNDITALPSFEGCQNVQELYFGNNFIEEIPDEFYTDMVHLKCLELRDNKIKTLGDAFDLPHLIKLDLTNNDLTTVPQQLSMLPHLQSLKLEGNKLKHIRTDVIKAGTTRILQHLREQQRDSGEEAQLPNLPLESDKFPDRYTMRNGNMLNLAMRTISQVPDECFQEAVAANVSMVDLCKNLFTEIPKGLQLLSGNLSELNLSHNHISTVPDWFSTMEKLKYLNLSNNQLGHLPDNLSEMVHLRELVLSNNKFQTVPDCVFGMIGLEILLLNDNNLSEINVEGLGKLTRLANLDLSNNNIGQVPPELGNLKQLKHLGLCGNSFRQPRYAILEQGTESILAYLRDRIPQ